MHTCVMSSCQTPCVAARPAVKQTQSSREVLLQLCLRRRAPDTLAPRTVRLSATS